MSLKGKVRSFGNATYDVTIKDEPNIDKEADVIVRARITDASKSLKWDAQAVIFYASSFDDVDQLQAQPGIILYRPLYVLVCLALHLERTSQTIITSAEALRLSIEIDPDSATSAHWNE